MSLEELSNKRAASLLSLWLDAACELEGLLQQSCEQRRELLQVLQTLLSCRARFAGGCGTGRGSLDESSTTIWRDAISVEILPILRDEIVRARMLLARQAPQRGSADMRANAY